jgi:DNA polymerase III sliding clamp (beta) subunit (PCNA family)
MEIGFKAPFFIETVSSMDAGSIEIRFKEPSKAILLQPSAEERKDEPFEAVLMPVVVG